MSNRLSYPNDEALGGIRAQAERFLHALFGPHFAAEHVGYIEVRIIGPAGVQSRFFPFIESVLEALPGLRVANEPGRNIYIGVNPRCRERGRVGPAPCPPER